MGYLGEGSPAATVAASEEQKKAAIRTAVNPFPVGRMVALFGYLAAGAISYTRNKSLLWAFGSSLVWPVYMAYIGIQSFTRPGGLKGQLKYKPNPRRGKKRRRGRKRR